MIKFESTGNFKKTLSFFDRIKNAQKTLSLEQYGAMGVEALASATPVRTGLTASSWSYSIEQTDGKLVISWENSNVNDGVNIAIILQYGHGTRDGGYIVGVDYINPALAPVFEKIADSMWKEVTSI